VNGAVAVHVSGVSKQFPGVRAVDGVSVDVHQGEALAVIGPNGAGKSTLFGLLAGEHQPDGGEVELFGVRVTGWSASRLARAGVSRTFQVARMFPSRSVEENVLVALAASRRRSMSWRDRFGCDRSLRDRVSKLLDATGLTGRAALPALALGQADRKRLELAMALSQEPRVLLLDEPTAGMGREEAADTVSTLAELHRTRPETSIVLTAHDMEVIFALADRVLLMADGAVRLVGTPAEIEAHSLTREIYLGAPAR
jgi:branched-chain amino acid transport system ATP-binding protein